MLTGCGCGEDTLCPFLSLIGRTEVTAQGSGWNFALDDLILFAGASTGTAGVKPVRKQALACWLLLLTHSHPGSAEQVHRTQSREGCRFPRHSQKQGLGCVCWGGVVWRGMCNSWPACRRPSVSLQEEIPRAEDEQGPPLRSPLRCSQAGLPLPAHGTCQERLRGPGVRTRGFCP